MIQARKLLAIAFLFIGFSGGAIFLFLAVTDSPIVPVRATMLPEPRLLPEFSLTDQHDQRFTRDDLAGQWRLVFFGFTNCPDICPATLQQLAIARRRAMGDGDAFPGIVLVSVDPERDSPAAMAAYVGNFGDGVTGLTGSIEELMALTRPLGIYFSKSGDPDGNYSVDHSSVVLLIDDAANWRAVFSAPHDVDSFVSDVALLMDAG